MTSRKTTDGVGGPGASEAGAMVVETHRTMAVKCPSCERSSFHAFSAFSLTGPVTHRLQCRCGYEIVVFIRRDHKWEIRHECSACAQWHTVPVSANRLFLAPVHVLSCLSSGESVALIGRAELVRRRVISAVMRLDKVVDLEEMRGYFRHPGVMRDALYRLYRLAKEGKASCGCGNGRLDADLFPEKVRVACPACGGSQDFRAVTEEDRQRVSSIEELVLPPVTSVVGAALLAGFHRSKPE